ncbi:transposase family protein [Streptomyces sp. NPDC101249]|uniref:transposase family protein n=1 Tax=Streptomyces sp. NPDC101249 TaxID=3366140 RepID=UPI003805898F
MLVHPSSMDLSRRTSRYLSARLHARSGEIEARWRRLPAGRQALLALAHLRCGAGSVHDLIAARTHGIVDALATGELKCWADKAYQGAGHPIRVPFRGRRLRRWQRRHNSTHAKIRCLGEQAMATLKGWRLLRRLRRSITRITEIVQAVLVLHHAST